MRDSEKDSSARFGWWVREKKKKRGDESRKEREKIELRNSLCHKLYTYTPKWKPEGREKKTIHKHTQCCNGWQHGSLFIGIRFSILPFPHIWFSRRCRAHILHDIRMVCLLVLMWLCDGQLFFGELRCVMRLLGVPLCVTNVLEDIHFGGKQWLTSKRTYWTAFKHVTNMLHILYMLYLCFSIKSIILYRIGIWQTLPKVWRIVSKHEKSSACVSEWVCLTIRAIEHC